MICRNCQSNDTDRPHGWCLSCVESHARAERVAQGLPPTVEDPETLRKIAVIVASAGESA